MDGSCNDGWIDETLLRHVFFLTQTTDGGMYTCKVSNVAGQVDRTFKLTVHGKNVSELHIKNLNINIGKVVGSSYGDFLLLFIIYSHSSTGA